MTGNNDQRVRQSTRVFYPRVGMLATVRSRRAIISSVNEFDSRTDGIYHLVRLEYIDSDGVPEDTIIWERESHCSLLEPAALPQITSYPPMQTDEFDALARATRWTALLPCLMANWRCWYKESPFLQLAGTNSIYVM